MPNETAPLVSLLIPVYGVELYIEECLRSVLQQEYDFLEIILIDDCSPDQSIPLAEQVISRDNIYNHGVRIIRHEQNLGQSGARQTAVSAARGEFIMFLDSDDYFLSPFAVKKTIDCMQAEQADMALFNYIELFKRTQRTSRIPAIKEPTALVHAFLRGDTPAYLWNKCFRRDAFIRNANLWEIGNNMWEDMQNVVPYTLSVRRIAYIDQSLVAYRRTNERSVTLDPSHKNVASMQRVVRFLEQLFAERSTGEELEAYKRSCSSAYHQIEVGVLCHSSYDDFCRLLKGNDALWAYIGQMKGMAGYFLRGASLFYRLRLAPLGYALLLCKEFLQKIR